MSEYRIQRRLAELERAIDLLGIVINGTIFTSGKNCDTFGDIWERFYETLRELEQLREEDAATFAVTNLTGCDIGGVESESWEK